MTEKSDTVNAHPTKEFFIDMLVKDISKEEAIIDLIDNCVDGALRIRSDRKFEDLWIRIELEPDYFRINDNCGGIPLSLARDYAFRFGRPEQMLPTLHSIGQFGVGMKRAFFRLGSKFEVKSRDENSSFLIEADVNEWRSKDEWTFTFADQKDQLPNVSTDEKGTTITVSDLHKSVSDDFKDDRFKNGLKKKIKDAHRLTIENGLAVSMNKAPLEVDPHTLLNSEYIQSAYREFQIDQMDGSINVKIYAGISQSEPEDAGWYIYCNGRLIIGADHTLTTGWGTVAPKFHNQYARYRGFTFFDSDNASLLPWNTTKSGIDADSNIYRGVRQQMYNMMRPVITFLNKLDREKDVVEKDHQPLKYSVDNADHVKLSNLVANKTFVALKGKSKEPVKRKGRIAYNKPQDQIDEVKKVLGVSKLIEVGEGTFDYFYDRECKE